MPILNDTFASYVPQVALRLLASLPEEQLQLPIEVQASGPTVLLFADTSGFTAFTERLAARGPAGAEELTAILNNHFGQLIKLLQEFGGDVVKFAGDALIALWTCGSEAELDDAIMRASTCALEIQHLLARGSSVGLYLAMRLAIGAGNLTSALVGNAGARPELLLAGEALEQIAPFASLVRPGDVALSHACWLRVGARLDCREVTILGDELTTGARPGAPSAPASMASAVASNVATLAPATAKTLTSSTPTSVDSGSHAPVGSLSSAGSGGQAGAGLLAGQSASAASRQQPSEPEGARQLQAVEVRKDDLIQSGGLQLSTPHIELLQATPSTLEFLTSPLKMMSEAAGKAVGAIGEGSEGREGAALALPGLASLHPTHPSKHYVRLIRVMADVPRRPLQALTDEVLLERLVPRFIPRAISSRLNAGQRGWLAELRRVSVLFVKLPGLQKLLPENLPKALEIVSNIQSVVGRFEGSVNKLSLDEKGVCLVAAFGLPPLAHEDDAGRAALCALELRQLLHAAGIRCSIGLTTGRAYCGSVGNERRREYTLMGDVVNVAARLMTSSPDGILCDEATVQAARNLVSFQFVAEIALKGKGKVISAWAPSSRLEQATGEREMVGRQEELTRLAKQLERLIESGEGGVMVLEGEPGMGKSTLVAALSRQAELLNLFTLSGAGSSIDRSATYRPWRSIVSQLLGIDRLASFPERMRQIERMLSHRQELLRLLPLLSGILPIDLPDNDETIGMAGPARADNIRELLVQLVSMAAARLPTWILIEDVHWMDSASWALASHVAQRIPHLVMLLTTRPMAEPLQTDCAQLLALPQTTRIWLEPLQPSDIQSLVCKRLQVRSIPVEVANLIQSRADGQPLFSEELALALRDEGLIVVANGECRLAGDVSRLSKARLPDTVQGIITARLDRLPPEQQLGCKVASVIGRSVEGQQVAEVYPIESDRGRVPLSLQALSVIGFMQEPQPGHFLFKHAITQEVAYNLMSYAQRRALHQRVAEWYEKRYAGELHLHLAVLAYHWELTGNLERTFYYLEKAGEHALRTGADRESAAFFSRALDLLSQQVSKEEQDEQGNPRTSLMVSGRTMESGAAPSVSGTFAAGPSMLNASGMVAAVSRRDELLALAPPERVGHWRRMLADATLGLGDVTRVISQASEAVSLLDEPLPEGTWAWVYLLLWQSAIQFWHVLTPRHWHERPGAVQKRQMEAALACERLSEAYYFRSDVLRMLAVTVKALNLAEGAGEDNGAYRAYAIMGMLVGMFRLHMLAGFYFKLGRAVARRSSDRRGDAIMLYYEAVYQSGYARWEDVIANGSAGLQVSRALGVRYEIGICLTILLLAEYFHGRFPAALALSRELLTEARAASNVQHQSWGHYTAAESLIPLGRLEEAMAELQQAQALFARHDDELSRIIVQGLKALTLARQENWALSLQEADAALALIRRSIPYNWASLEGYAGTAEAYLLLQEHYQRSGDAREILVAHSAREALTALKQFAQLYPIGRPRLHHLLGRTAWLERRRSRARREWERSLGWARRLDMPFEEALTHYDIGRYTQAPVQAGALERAHAIFVHLGCQFHLKAIERLWQQGHEAERAA